MAPKLYLIVSISCVVTVAGQWPLPASFYNGMNQLQNNMQNMRQRINNNMQNMRQNLQNNMQTMRNNLQNNMQTMRNNHQNNMQRMRTNLQNNMQIMRRNLQAAAREREAIFEQNYLLAQNGVDFGENGKIFEPVEGGFGFAYNSTDGSYTMYVISTGNPPRGFMQHFDTNGNQMYNSW